MAAFSSSLSLRGSQLGLKLCFIKTILFSSEMGPIAFQSLLKYIVLKLTFIFKSASESIGIPRGKFLFTASRNC